MITVIRADHVECDYPTAARFLTEETFNNLCLHDEHDNLIAVYAQDQWISVEVTGDGSGKESG